MTRRNLIVANWKMHKSTQETIEYVKKLSDILPLDCEPCYVAAPFTLLPILAQKAKGSPVIVGAQNMHPATAGAFTGEISAEMLREVAAEFVILGHSERRALFKEEHDFINQKVQKALESQLTPILCVGETLEERTSGQTREVLMTQILACLAGIPKNQMQPLCIAYEPVWAIGTGKVATPELIQESHKVIRDFVASTWGEEFAQNLPILYGGSVKPENAHAAMSLEDVDGLLVGGASLDPESFAQIIQWKNAKVER